LTTRPAPIASGPTAGAKVAAVPVFQVAGEQPLDLLLVRAHHRPFRVTVGQFGRRVEQAAAAEAVLVCLRRVIGVGVEDGQDALAWADGPLQPPAVQGQPFFVPASR
jgi:hypothetical protein